MCSEIANDVGDILASYRGHSGILFGLILISYLISCIMYYYVGEIS